MTQSVHVVYPPPQQGAPYLAVTIAVDGTILACPYESEEDAQRHVRAADAAERKGQDDGADMSLLGSLLR